MQIIAISLFGVVGILSRYGIDKAVAPTSSGFPISTFLINILGCALAGIVFVFAEQGQISVNTQTALLVGFCGGFTTFSAYGLQTALILEKGKYLPALSYFLVSPALGLLAAFAAITLTRRFF